MRAFLAARWQPLLAGLATLGYAACVLGFGLVYRPLENDEGVTLQVASANSVRGVLDIAINSRHGPPLHYLLAHLSLQWHDDMLGLRLPSALLGILAVPLAYGCGRELLGRTEGALMALFVAASPLVVHLGQFARGYTAMLAACFGSLWLLLLLLRTRRLRYAAGWGVAAALLAASHPFGLFALFSELILLFVLGFVPLVRRRRENRPALIATAVALVLGAAAALALRHVYSPLQDKYKVGSGGAVIDPFSSGVWRDLGEAWFGTEVVVWWFVVALAALAGLVALARHDRRAALVIGVWIAQPLVTLSILSAGSSDFAPQRHLSFLLPAFVAALAFGVAELGRRVPHGQWAAAAACSALLLPGLVAIVNDVGNFTPDLRDASLDLASRFGPNDALLTTAGRSDSAVPARLYGAYAVLEAGKSSPLSSWRHLGDATGCTLVNRLGGQRPHPGAVWLLLRPPDPQATADALTRAGADQVERHGTFVIARLTDHAQNVEGALRAGARGYHAADTASEPKVADFGVVARYYRLARALAAAGLCN